VLIAQLPAENKSDISSIFQHFRRLRIHWTGSVPFGMTPGFAHQATMNWPVTQWRHGRARPWVWLMVRSSAY